MNLIAGVDIIAGALNAQKTRLDIVAQNIANAQTTRAPGGGAYQRQVVSFETELIRHMTALAEGNADADERIRVDAFMTVQEVLRLVAG